jgi:predicted alpha/beta superfamily hydrolase
MTGMQPRFGLFNTEARILQSACVGEVYQIGIWFPFSYSSSRETYPVLYLTDGDYTFGLATGLIPTLIGTQEIPEMLVVGIGYNHLSNYSEFGEFRERDMLPPGFAGAPPDSRTPQFMAFLRQELFPLIEANYRASPDDRTLYGFSVGGFFALYTMLTQPGLFRRYIAASCTWPAADAYLLACERKYAGQSSHPPVDLYFAVGGLEEDQLPGFHAMVELLQQRDYANLRFQAQIFEGEKHSAGVISQTFLNGLRSVFQSG